MFSLLALYFPSLIGLIIVNWQLFELIKIAREKKSIATSFLFAITLSTAGVLVSWFIVFEIAISLMKFGLPILNWRIALLPTAWAVLLILINRNLRK